MNYRKTALTAAIVLSLGAPLWAQQAPKAATEAQADPGYASYIAQRKARLSQSLSQRIDTINQRFDEEMAFRRKLKDERIAFAQKMETQEAAFLDSLQAQDPQSRLLAWSAYYQKTGQEKELFYTGLRQESQQFWKSRLNPMTAALPQDKAQATK